LEEEGEAVCEVLVGRLLKIVRISAVFIMEKGVKMKDDDP